MIAVSCKSYVVNIDNREIFIDNYLIKDKRNVELFLHKPTLKEKVILFDKKWEGPFSGYMTILKDTIYRLYYRGHDRQNKKATTCYAESRDGISWDKPDLGLYEVSGTYNNNVIMTNNEPFEHNFSPFIDSNPNTPSNQKFKAIAGKKESGLYRFVSADGINWSFFSSEPFITNIGRESDYSIFDSQNVAFWSESEQMYVCYYRTWKKINSTNYRTVSRTTSLDFINWTSSEEIIIEGDNLDLEQIYTNQTHPYFRAPHIYISTAARFVPNCNAISTNQAESIQVNKAYFNDCSDIILMSSRGGTIFKREFPEAFIKPEIGYNNWTSRTNYPVLNIIQTSPEEMSLYVQNNYGQPTAHLVRYAIRLDGLASIRAKYVEGKFTTKPFILESKNLFINYSTSAAGYILVEVMNHNYNVIPGFSKSNSQKIVGNEIKREVLWNGGTELSSLLNKPISLRFIMKEADIYSISFE
jgi:hypothetical protein